MSEKKHPPDNQPNYNHIISSKYARDLDILLSDIFLDFFKYQYKQSVEKYDKYKKSPSGIDGGIEGKSILMIFQDSLVRISKWTKERKIEAYDNIKKNGISGDTLRKLVTGFYEAFKQEYLRTLTFTFNENNVVYRCPSNPKFIYCCLKYIARELWKRPFLMITTQPKEKKDKNLIEIKKIISVSIMTTIGDAIPIKEIFDNQIEYKPRAREVDAPDNKKGPFSVINERVKSIVNREPALLMDSVNATGGGPDPDNLNDIDLNNILIEPPDFNTIFGQSDSKLKSMVSELYAPQHQSKAQPEIKKDPEDPEDDKKDPEKDNKKDPEEIKKEEPKKDNKKESKKEFKVHKKKPAEPQKEPKKEESKKEEPKKEEHKKDETEGDEADSEAGNDEAGNDEADAPELDISSEEPKPEPRKEPEPVPRKRRQDTLRHKQQIYAQREKKGAKTPAQKQTEKLSKLEKIVSKIKEHQ